MYEIPPSMPSPARFWWRILTSLLAFACIGLIGVRTGFGLGFVHQMVSKALLRSDDLAVLLQVLVIPALLVPVTFLRLKYPLIAGMPKNNQGFRLTLSILFWLGLLVVMGFCGFLILYWNGIPG